MLYRYLRHKESNFAVRRKVAVAVTTFASKILKSYI